MSSLTTPPIEETLSGFSEVMLATAEGNQPRVRPVTLVNNQGQLYLMTGTNSRKVDQIKSNNSVEIVKVVRVGEKTGYVRFSALAHIVEDQAIKARIADETPFFTSYWEHPTDPTYTLIQFQITTLSYLKPDAMEETIIEDFHLTG
jgi:general stress protein 26